MVEVSRTAITLFGWKVHWYGVLIVAGVALGVMLAYAREKRYGLPKDAALDLTLVCLPAAIVGARIYYVAFSWEAYAQGPWQRVFAVWEGGLAIYGGVLGGLIAGAIYAKVKKISFLSLADLAAPCLALGQAVGRWGNFINQEAHGGLVTNPALRFFPAAVNISGQWYYATFFYESAWCLCITAILLYAEKKYAPAKGQIALGYVLLYGLERGAVEGLRTDSLMLGPWRVSQLLSLLAAFAAAEALMARAERAPRSLRHITGCLPLAALVCLSGESFWPWLSFGFSLLTLILTAVALRIDRRKKQIETEAK